MVRQAHHGREGQAHEGREGQAHEGREGQAHEGREGDAHRGREHEHGPGAPPPREAPEKVAAARTFCEELLRRMGGDVAVAVKETAEAIGVSLEARPGNRLELNGSLVEAVQVLANRVVNPRAEGRKWVNLDVGGFPDDGDPAVKAMAARLAAAAVRSGKVLAVGPMSARERRQVHLALVEVPGVSTHSEGEGLFRQLLVIPDPKAPGA